MDDPAVDKLKKEIEKLRQEEERLKKEEEGLMGAECEAHRKPSPAAEKQPKNSDETESEEPPPPQETELIAGHTYLVEEDKPHTSVEKYIESLEKGFEGLLITRSNPDQLKSDYPGLSGETYWLTNVKTDKNKSLSGLQEISITISNFIDTHEKSAVLLDGLEYLVSNNDFQIVLKLVQQVRDKVSTADSVMLMPLNPPALESR
ncbi:MAG: DUF835 domain-containing protein, partial [Candidatus Altiarchaeales archaeon]|nr:DUF835 domain-containing protein [Candidatus Altiarchaeales archaeon]